MARHTLEEENEDAEPALIPSILVDITALEPIEYIIVAPWNIGVVVEPLKASKIGSVTVSYPLIADEEKEDDDDYDEDEQLYSAMTNRSLRLKYKKEVVPIRLHENGTASIVVPHITNTVAYNVLARQLTETLKPTAGWITLAPCNINNNQTLSKLQGAGSQLKLTHAFDLIPALRPPHFITGVSAAVSAEINRTDLRNHICLVLNSEGQPGFEKIETDAIVDAAYVLADILVDASKKEAHLSAVSTAVRKFNGYSNSGMYI